MRISDPDFNRLKELIDFDPCVGETLAKIYSNKGMTPKRFRWDMLWTARRKRPDDFNELFDKLYSYANDDHVDTALRYIVADNNWRMPAQQRKRLH